MKRHPHSVLQWLSQETSDFMACRSVERVHASKLTPISFIRDFVKPSRPVIIEGLLESSGSGFDALRKWTLDYLLERVGDEVVRWPFFTR